MAAKGDVTRILSELRGVDRQEALNRLVPAVYAELRTAARAQLRRERPGHTLGATALVHEVYLRLLGGNYPDWNDRQHFFRAAAEAMRRILVEHARGRARVKRGGNPVRISLDEVTLAAQENPEQLLAVDWAIRRLEEQEPTAAEVVRLRFFAGLSVEEVAQTLDLSQRTVQREWAFARAWLYRALGKSAR